MPLDTFDSDFITEHTDAFEELVLLGTTISQNSSDGIESPIEYEKGFKLQTLLKARRSEGLSAKEEEALDGCLRLLTEANFVPSASTLLPIDTDYILTEEGTYMLLEDGGIMLLE